MAAGSMTITENRSGTVKKIKVAWIAGTAPSHSGLVSGTTTYPYSGRLFGAITVPSGSAPPTASYDIVVNDSDSVDIALGALVDRSQTATEYRAEATMAGVAQSVLTIAVTNAGSAGAGTLYLFIR